MKKTKNLWKKLIKICIFTFIFCIIWIISINIYINTYSKNKIFHLYNISSAETWIILWASVRNDWILSDALRDRVLTAIELIKKDKIKKIFISWSTEWDYNEPDAIKNYLVKNGINSTKISLDYHWDDTFLSMKHAQEIFNIKNAIVITQKFHLPRSIFLCNKMQMTCSWVISDKQKYIKEKYFKFREFFANIKVIYNLYF